MKVRGLNFILASLLALLFAACADSPPVADSPVRTGLSRNDVLVRFGEPLRVEADGAGGEDWWYRFTWWETQPTGVTESHDEFGDRTSSVSVGLNISKPTEERPIHISPEGYVVEPVPKGRLIKNR